MCYYVCRVSDKVRNFRINVMLAPRPHYDDNLLSIDEFVDTK